MATQEVFAAVAAVVSAFHGGADLVANIKKKSGRRSSLADDDDESERKKLRVSLETGESQVGFRYAADMNKFGDMVRIGDDIARERILHIAIVIQTEIIMSLQLAVKYENAVVDFEKLHEASILNRKDTMEALDELKQRILLRGPVPRNLTGSPSPTTARFSINSISSVRSSRTSINTCVPDTYMPHGVTFVPDGSAPSQNTALAQYFAAQAREESSNSTPQPDSQAPSETIYLPPAIEHLLEGKGPEERAAVMKDIDEIIAAYQGLSVEHDRAAALAMLTGQESTSSKRDTLMVLNGGGSGSRDTADLNRDALRLLGELPPANGVSHENTEYPAQLHDIFDWKNEPKPRRLSDWNHYPRSVSQASRWSTTSAGTTSSSIYSQNTISDPPSLYRYNSDSSGSPASPNVEFKNPFYSQNYPDSVYSTNTTAPFWGMDRLQNPPDISSSSSRTNTPPARPLTPKSEVPPIFAPPNASFANQSRPRAVVKDSKDGLTAGGIRVHLVPSDNAQQPKAVPTPLAFANSPTHMNTRKPLATAAKPLPQLPLTPTLANPNPAAPAVAEKMMDGRPCKDNNYWGFCKGAWATREDVRKGLALETRPEGMYNTSQIWQCKHCNFEGASFPNPRPTKRPGAKKELVVDPHIYTSAVGIRYRWLFLAKSHVKKKTFNSGAGADGAARMSTIHKRQAGTGGQAVQDGECSFGCVVCSVEGNVTGIYGNVETLMNHIFMEHVRGGQMSEQTLARSKFVLGRTAGPEEEWDVNVTKEGVLLF